MVVIFEGGGGCNELAAVQGYWNTAQFLLLLFDIHLRSRRSGGRGEERRVRKKRWWIPSLGDYDEI